MAQGLELGNVWHEHYGGGIGDSGGEQDQRECHSGEYAVNAKGFLGRVTVCLKPLGDEDDFNAAQEGEEDSVYGEGDG